MGVAGCKDHEAIRSASRETNPPTYPGSRNSIAMLNSTGFTRPCKQRRFQPMRTPSRLPKMLSTSHGKTACSSWNSERGGCGPARRGPGPLPGRVPHGARSPQPPLRPTGQPHPAGTTQQEQKPPILSLWPRGTENSSTSRLDQSNNQPRD